MRVWLRQFFALFLVANLLAVGPTSAQAQPFCHQLLVKKEQRSFQWDLYNATYRDLQTSSSPERMIQNGIERVEAAMAVADYVTQKPYFKEQIEELQTLKMVEPIFLLRPRLFYKKLFKGRLERWTAGFRLPWLQFERQSDARQSFLSMTKSALKTRQGFSKDPKKFYQAIVVLAIHVNTLSLYSEVRDRKKLPKFSLRRLRPTPLSPKKWLTQLQESMGPLVSQLENLAEATGYSLQDDLEIKDGRPIRTNRFWIGLTEVSWRLFTGFYDPISKMPRDPESLQNFLGQGPVFKAMKFRMYSKWMVSRLGQLMMAALVAHYGFVGYLIVDTELHAQTEAEKTAAQIEERTKRIYDDELEDDFQAGVNFLEEDLFNSPY